ncbi:MAG: aminoacyl-tRNA hydrolase, partial [Lactobacillus iners]|nr:aminoacyl-tRNA hydrolase [Lactobacillus iners]
LTPFSSEDCTKMEATFATVSQIIDDFIDNKSIEFLMNKYN